MSDFQITNCHVHTFTAAHVPEGFPHPWLAGGKQNPGLILLLSRLARLFGQEDLSETLHRLWRFQQQGDAPTQAEIFADVAAHYPSQTRFVVLPMDMSQSGYGASQADLRAQHDELAALRDGPQPRRGQAIPFATVDPRSAESIRECLRALRELKFAGLKIYPRLGFAPDHPDLIRDIYPVVAELGLPVMTHCSRGGVQGRGMLNAEGDRYTRPYAYERLLRDFPDLRVCLAHFGGVDEWRAYLEARDTRGMENWMEQIRDMIGSGDYPNLWTDISYTLFHFDDFGPVLKLLLAGEDASSRRLRERVLFGSDFYLTRQEELSERAVSMRMRVLLGETLFRQIAHENPSVWLGEG